MITLCFFYHVDRLPLYIHERYNVLSSIVRGYKLTCFALQNRQPADKRCPYVCLWFNGVRLVSYLCLSMKKDYLLSKSNK